jgi:3-oxoacyl-[acyl-carrier-protein] synthase II
MSIPDAVAAVTSWSVYLPDLPADGIPGVPPRGPVYPPADARRLLGRKGLLFKEPATRLALCAVHRALGHPDGVAPTIRAVDPDTAVVVSTNLGNVATVCDVARTVRAAGWRDVSPLGAPNASSNVIASTIAIWYGLGGPNLTVCSGATAGLDAVGIGIRLLRARRARRVVVVGAEPADPDALALHGLRAGDHGPLRAVAACVVLEPVDVAPLAPTVGPVRRPAEGVCVEPDAAGDGYGARGVLDVAVAVARFGSATGSWTVQITGGDAADGWRQVEVGTGGPAPTHAGAVSQVTNRRTE